MLKVVQRMFQNTTVKMGLIFASRMVSALLGIILLPIYIRYLGSESYGLVAFYATLAGTLTVLVNGLGSATAREISILHATGAGGRKMTSLLFSSEILHWLIALVFGVLILAFSNLISVHWLNARNISPSTLKYSIMLMGILFTLQVPASVYEGSLNGVHRQGESAVINLLFAIVKSVGVIFILKFIKADIITYFLWQVIIASLLTLSLRIFAYRYINASKVKKFFSIGILKTVNKFAMGVTGIAIVTFFINQIDKVIVSKFLSLEVVGYYNIAFLLASVLTMLITPIQTIVFPKFNALEARHKSGDLRRLYYKTSKWVTILVLPVGCILIAFSNDLLWLWTKNVKLVEETSPILKIVAGGTIINSICSIYYFYTLAKGNTRFGFYQNLFSVFLILPLAVILTKNYGAIGASFCWLIYNSLLLLISLPLFHYFYLKNQVFFWVKETLIYPASLCFLLFFGSKFLLNIYYPHLGILKLAALIFMLVCLYFLTISETRNLIFKHLKKNIKYSER
ncbi:oligosaccharide flippase family protein [Niabella hirudinis]|uniref:oligosaccharide flippase family protein n=1 Tax=Niabella hirudinis TaxID=1285929 RepID=UPI003EBB9071